MKFIFFNQLKVKQGKALKTLAKEICFITYFIYNPNYSPPHCCMLELKKKADPNTVITQTSNYPHKTGIQTLQFVSTFLPNKTLQKALTYFSV